MQKAEAQHNHEQHQAATRQGKGMALDSPQGEQIAQLEAMVESSPQTGKLAQLAAMVDASPAMAAQRKTMEIIRNSPAMTAQREAVNGIAQREAAPAKPNNSGLPDNLKAGIENLSGMSMDNVKVHYNSSQPAQLNALAYAQGTDIHVAPGQEQHLPHEAWHVVQQAQGRVKPTMQMKDGVPVNDDSGLEHEADVMGGEALASAAQQGLFGGAQLRSAPIHISYRPSPVQRMIGFEVEYKVPTYGKAVEPVTLKDGQNPASSKLKYLLFGGLGYASDLGGSAKLGDDSFRVTSDHRAPLTRERLRQPLAKMGLLDPAGTQDRDASSNLEYVTSPVDELAAGADKKLGGIIDGVVSHATDTFGKATDKTVTALKGPATNVASGTGENEFKDWLSPSDWLKLKPAHDEFVAEIEDDCYLQATVGILPSAIWGQFNKLAQGDLHYNTGKFEDSYKAIASVASAAWNAVKSHEYLTSRKDDKELVAGIKGLVTLLAQYLVGEALSQTSAHPGGSIKNALPLLVKVSPRQLTGTVVQMPLFDAIPDEVVQAVADAIANCEEIKVDYWLHEDRGYTPRVRKDEDKVTVGTVKDLATLFLQGKQPPKTGIQTGSTIPNVDDMPEISSIFETFKGIPLEYRYIMAKPKATGLKAELMKIVEESRAINLSRVPEKKRNEIVEQVKK